MRHAPALHLIATLSLAAAACGQNSDTTPGGTGGAQAASGGNTNANGGSPTSGGQSASGGNATTGGAAASGGDATVGGAAASGGDATVGGAPAAFLLPFKTGNSWTYRVTDGTEVSTKVTTVEEAQEVGGSGPNKSLVAFRVVTRKGLTGTDQTVSWQAVVGDKVLRYRELAFGATTQMVKLEEHWDPYKLHIDGTSEHTIAGATWVETYVETKLPAGGTASSATNSDTWKVIASSETVEVPAGSFDAVVFEKSGSKRYWYVRGVGKVKETGSQTEELTAYVVKP